MTIFEKAVVGVLMLCAAAIVAINLLTSPGDSVAMTPLSAGGAATGGDDAVGDGSHPTDAGVTGTTRTVQPAFPDEEDEPSGSEATVSKNLYVNINTASLAELETLPGVGQVLAGRIVEYREAHGPFKSADELINVSGIGAKTLDNLRPYIVVE